MILNKETNKIEPKIQESEKLEEENNKKATI